MSYGKYEFRPEDAFDFARAQGAEVHKRGDELKFKLCPYCKGLSKNGGKADKETFSINLITGQYKCLRSSCNVSGNMLTLAQDFNFRLPGVEEFRPKQQYRKFKTPEKPITPKPEALKYLESRGISAGTAAKYEITVQTDKPNILVFPFYDETGKLQFIKYRKTDFVKDRDKNKEWSEKGGKPILFGMKQCSTGNKTLVLTEGQIDSLSVAEAGIENAVSVPTGQGGFTWYPNCYDWMQQFSTLIVFGDHENGRITLLDAMKSRFHGIVKVVQAEDYKGCKDANEILQKFGRDAVRAAVENAKTIPLKGLIELADVQPVNLFDLPKTKTGVAGLDKVLSGGMYQGQLIVLTGKRGDGKSTFAGMILANALNAGKRILAYSGELPNYFFRAWLDAQIAGRHHMISKMTDNDTESYYLSRDNTQAIGEWYRGRAILYDNTVIEDDEIPELLDLLEKGIVRYGIDILLLDNLMTALDIDMGADLYRAQSKFVDKLKKIATRHKIVVILVAHPRKNKMDSDDPDEISGAADIANKADIVMSYRRLKSSDELEWDGILDGDSTRKLVISKNRLTGRLAMGEKAITLYYDPASKRVSDNADNFARPFAWEHPGLNDGFEPVPEEDLIFE